MIMPSISIWGKGVQGKSRTIWSYLISNNSFFEASMWENGINCWKRYGGVWRKKKKIGIHSIHMILSKQGHVQLNCEGAASINFQKYIIFGTLPEYLTVDRGQGQKAPKTTKQMFYKKCKKTQKRTSENQKVQISAWTFRQRIIFTDPNDPFNPCAIQILSAFKMIHKIHMIQLH